MLLNSFACFSSVYKVIVPAATVQSMTVFHAVLTVLPSVCVAIMHSFKSYNFTKIMFTFYEHRKRFSELHISVVPSQKHITQNDKSDKNIMYTLHKEL